MGMFTFMLLCWGFLVLIGWTLYYVGKMDLETFGASHFWKRFFLAILAIGFLVWLILTLKVTATVSLLIIALYLF